MAERMRDARLGMSDPVHLPETHPQATARLLADMLDPAIGKGHRFDRSAPGDLRGVASGWRSRAKGRCMSARRKHCIYPAFERGGLPIRTGASARA